MSLCQQCGSFTFHHKLCSACKKEPHPDFKPKPPVRPINSAAEFNLQHSKSIKRENGAVDNSPEEKQFFNNDFINHLKNNRKPQ